MDNILIKSLSAGLKDGGLKFITNFPGYMSHKLFEACGGQIYSINEKIAYELAWGSALGGKRSVTTFKNVGLNDAADPFINSMLLDINAGLVMVVFDDTDIEGSQCKLDSRNYIDFFGGLWFEPCDIQSAYDIAYGSFDISEKLNIPIVIRITSQLVNQKGDFKRKKKSYISSKQFNRTNKDYVVHPVNSKYQQAKLRAKKEKVQAYVNNIFKIPDSMMQQDIVRLSFGCNARELHKKDNIIQISTYPLPENIKNFKKQKIEIFEQGTNYAAEKIKTLFSESIAISYTGNEPDNSPKYIISENYRKLFEILNEDKTLIKIGDLGEYTMDDLNSINACLCFGSALSVAAGLKSSSSINEVFAITGDASFLHSGKNIIPELLKRNIKINIIVIDNGGSMGTGGQKIPGNIEQGLTSLDYKTIDFKKISQNDLKNEIKTQMNNSVSSAIILKY